MKRSFVRSIGASALLAVVILLSSCGGGGSSSSSGGSSITAGKTILQGNISNSGAVSALFKRPDSNQVVSSFTWDLWQGFIPEAQAQMGLPGVNVCVQTECVLTNGNGEFMLDLTGLTEGPYVITFSYGGTDYFVEVRVKNQTITSLNGIILEDGGKVTITDIQVTSTGPVALDDEDSEDGPVAKIAICHKPGTSAEHTLWLPSDALDAHYGHGDTPGACAE